jgi:hypothetical protein
MSSLEIFHPLLPPPSPQRQPAISGKQEASSNGKEESDEVMPSKVRKMEPKFCNE